MKRGARTRTLLSGPQVLQSRTESFEKIERRSAHSQIPAAHGDSMQGHVHHLPSVARAAALVEVGHVVARWEGAVWHLLTQELAQRTPALADVVLEQSLLRHQAAHLLHMVQVHLLALVREVAPEERVEELLQHGVVHAGGPAELRDELVLWISHAPVHRLHHRSESPVRHIVSKTCRGEENINVRMPRVDIPSRKDDLGIGVGLNQLFGKGASRPVADSLISLSVIRLRYKTESDRSIAPGSHPAAYPIPSAQTRQRHRTWRTVRRATSDSREDSRRWRTSCGRC